MGSFFSNILIRSINDFLVHVLNDVMGFFVGGIAREHEMALRILDQPFVVGAIQLAQVVAGSLLTLKIGVEILRNYILFSSGSSEVNPVKLVKRSMYAAMMIAGGPWLARNVFGYGAYLAVSISQVPLVAEGANPLGAILRGSVGAGFGFLLMFIAMVVFWALVYVQSIIRGVEVAFLSVSGPIMAVGLTGSDEGAWAVWWRELVVVSLSQAVQMLMLTGFFASLTAGQVVNGYSMLVGVAWLWVAFKTPSVLKQFAYHTGTGSLASGATRMGQNIASVIIKKK
ncbi:MAG: hypothetical protein KGZ53_03695 [Peptococcaceae bacterium]|nr:hypothetical protein [Peptococcaceae bacterium]